MKKLMIAALALVGFSAASYAQTVPVKKNEPAKMQVAKKTTNVATHTVSKTAVYKKPAKATAPTAKVNNTVALKTNGSKRVQAKKSMTTHSVTTQHVKKDGTPDKRYKENKKHS
jgi:hypothetical protein